MNCRMEISYSISSFRSNGESYCPRKTFTPLSLQMLRKRSMWHIFINKYLFSLLNAAT
uniref:Uncharacterized protein n=1 Tax=Medicago truncatula TaxID=3880 RepID=I3SYN4_MEDTR|nr:unknown [Medicago truncatula]